MQDSNGDTDIENRLMDMVMGEGRRERVRCMCMGRVTRKLTILYTK